LLSTIIHYKSIVAFFPVYQLSKINDTVIFVNPKENWTQLDFPYILASALGALYKVKREAGEFWSDC